jgi:hypothetical protein
VLPCKGIGSANAGGAASMIVDVLAINCIKHGADAETNQYVQLMCVYFDIFA